MIRLPENAHPAQVRRLGTWSIIYSVVLLAVWFAVLSRILPKGPPTALSLVLFWAPSLLLGTSIWRGAFWAAFGERVNLFSGRWYLKVPLGIIVALATTYLIVMMMVAINGGW